MLTHLLIPCDAPLLEWLSAEADRRSCSLESLVVLILQWAMERSALPLDGTKQ